MRRLLSAADLSRAEAIEILDTAATMAATQSREIKKLPALRGRAVVNLFFEDSTRTRISFERSEERRVGKEWRREMAGGDQRVERSTMTGTRGPPDPRVA